MIAWWHDFKRSRRERSLLLVCAGSDPGRVPFAMVSRKSGAMATVTGNELEIRHSIAQDCAWRFTIITTCGDVAKDLASKLMRREVLSIHPDGRIVAIIFRRDDWGVGPLWIGGDISHTGVRQSDYFQNGNKAFIHKRHVEQTESQRDNARS